MFFAAQHSITAKNNKVDVAHCSIVTMMIPCGNNSCKNYCSLKTHYYQTKNLLIIAEPVLFF
jgi:biotin synthase-like enzyme